MYSTIPVKQLNYFSGGSYDINELETFVNNFVFTKKITVTNPFIHTQLPLRSTLAEDFNLACVFENKISKRTCNYYLDNFLNEFFVYTISLDYPGFRNIFDAIKNDTANKEKFCV